MDLTTKTASPAHLEVVANEKDGRDHDEPFTGQFKTTAYQIVFSIFVGTAGWMYNFDLGWYFENA